MAFSLLSTYLHDHHAGSVVIREMLTRALEHEIPDRAFLERLDEEIADEQRSLEGAIKELGSGESFVKKAAGWAAEKLARFKIGASRDPLPHLEFLDGLLTGVRGKLGLWEVLETMPAEQRPSSLDLPKLIRQAEVQIADITACRIAAFARLLSADDAVGHSAP